nr:hypothetical protein [Thalassorhabdomicrobium marinisediminis]
MGRRRLTRAFDIAGLDGREHGAVFVLLKLGKILARAVGAGQSDQLPLTVFQKRTERDEQVIAIRLQNSE